MAFTDVNFAFNSLTQQEIDSETAYLADCVKDGVTNGTYYTKWVSGLTIIQREWATDEAAQSYLDFINTFVNKPQVCEIIVISTAPAVIGPVIPSPNNGEPEPDKHPGLF
jgi:hypothetical protein